MGRKLNPETEQRKPLFRNKDAGESVNSPLRTEKRMAAIQTLQVEDLGITRANDELHVRLASNTPLLLVEFGDIHYGSRSTDYKKLQELVATILAHPNVAVILKGDLIEGNKPAYHATIGLETPITPTEQIVDIVNILKPLVQQGRIIAQTSDYFGHDGWIYTESGVNGDYILNQLLNQGVSKNHAVQPIAQRGEVKISFPNGHTVSYRPNHIPGSKSKFDPTHGLIQQTQGYNELPDIISGAHIHQAAVAMLNYPDGSVSLIQSGTLKGVGQHKDKLGALANLGTVDELEQSTVIAPRYRHHPTNSKRVFPSHNISHGLRVQQVLEVRDNLEKQGIYAEIEERANEEARRSPVTLGFNSQKSKKTRTPHNEKVDKETSPAVEMLNKYGYSQQYKKLVFELSNILNAPILFQFLSNTRFGSNSADPEQVWNGYIAPAIRDPNRFILPGRNLIDGSVSKNPNRLQVVQETANLLKYIENQIPFDFLDAILRQDGWKRPVGKEPHQGGIPAGSTLASLIHGENARLAENKSELEFWIDTPDGKQLIKGVVMDGLEGHASYEKATFGLMQMYNKRKIAKDTDFIYGGHVPLSGYTVLPRKHDNGYIMFIAPGWPAHQANPRGKANVMQGSTAGLGIIYDPETRMLFPTGHYFQTEELYGAMKVDSHIKRVSKGNPDRYLKRTDRKKTR